MSRTLSSSVLVLALLVTGAACAQSRNPFVRPSAQEAEPAAATAHAGSPTASKTGRASAPARTVSPKPTAPRDLPPAAEPAGLPLPPALPPALVAGARLPALPGSAPNGSASAPPNAEPAEAGAAPAAPESRAFLTRDEIQARRSRCPSGLLATSASVKATAAGDLLVLKLSAPGCVLGVSAAEDWVSARLTSGGMLELVVEPNDEPTVRRTVLTLASPSGSESVTIQQASASK